MPEPDDTRPDRPLVAVFAGPNATVLNWEPLVTATKARLPLRACLLRFGGLPPGRDPDAPTADEIRATDLALEPYQEVFATH